MAKNKSVARHSTDTRTGQNWSRTVDRKSTVTSNKKNTKVVKKMEKTTMNWENTEYGRTPVTREVVKTKKVYKNGTLVKSKKRVY